MLTSPLRLRDPRTVVGFGVAGALLAVLGESLYERRTSVHGSVRPALAWLGLLLAVATPVAGREVNLGRGALRHALGGGRRAVLLGIVAGVGLSLLAGGGAASAVLLAVVLLLALTPVSRVAAGLVLSLPLPSAVGIRTLIDARTLCLGAAAGLGVGTAVPSTLIRLLCLAAAVVALVLLLRRPTPEVTTLLLLLAGLALVIPQAHAAGRTVTVHGDRAFTSTGITLKAGELVTIEGTGTVRFLGTDPKAVADPLGAPADYAGCGDPGFCGSLVGRIAGGGVFLVGRHVSFTVSTPGALELGINDFAFGDNKGTFRATVSSKAAVPGAVAVVPANPFSGEPQAGGGLADDVPGTSHRLVAGLGGALGALLGLGLGLSLRPFRTGVYEVGAAHTGAALLVEGDRVVVRTASGVEQPLGPLPDVHQCDDGTVVVRETEGGPAATFVPGELPDGQLVAGRAMQVVRS